MGVFVGLILSYLLVSLPVGLIIAKKYGHPDIRKEGSGNIGATNVARVVGKKAGLITLAGDVLKGVLPVLTFSLILGTDTWQKQVVISLAGLAAFLGHLFPIYLKFKGGKGVATATGVFLILCPLAVLADTIVFLAVLWRWRYVSLASLSAAAAMPLLIALFSNQKVYIILAAIVAAFIFYRHKANIHRLLTGTELHIKSNG
ncbi:MAG: glycerol-3-phosphate 1-O-acyltransferase PlsY [Candidatus Desulfofervidaceae bacterium]|nr:glycerol-3-phosphate 1-O-acyltransferase PlsY [Candidatus Desulfofervidaceae bacterium]